MNSYTTNSLRLLLVLVAVAAILVGCGSDSNPTGSGGGGGNSRPHFKQVSIAGNSFNPSSLTIAVGDTVQWSNGDNVNHTVTSNSGAELSSGTLSNGETYQHIFMTAGAFPYHCTVHPSMNGTVTVN